MFFVYLKDGRRVDIPEAASVVHRTMVLFLDNGDNIVEQFATNDIVAYSRMPYVEDAQGLNMSEGEARDLEGDLLMLRRHRRRRSSAPREQSYEASRAAATEAGLSERSLG